MSLLSTEAAPHLVSSLASWHHLYPACELAISLARAVESSVQASVLNHCKKHARNSGCSLSPSCRDAKGTYTVRAYAHIRRSRRLSCTVSLSGCLKHPHRPRPKADDGACEGSIPRRARNMAVADRSSGRGALDAPGAARRGSSTRTSAAILHQINGTGVNIVVESRSSDRG